MGSCMEQQSATTDCECSGDNRLLVEALVKLPFFRVPYAAEEETGVWFHGDSIQHSGLSVTGILSDHAIFQTRIEGGLQDGWKECRCNDQLQRQYHG